MKIFFTVMLLISCAACSVRIEKGTGERRTAENGQRQQTKRPEQQKKFNKEERYKSAQDMIGEGRFSEAFNVLNELIGRDKEDLKAYDLMGSLYRKMGGMENLRVAESYFYRVHKSVPGDTRVQMELAECAYLLGHSEKARIIFDEIYKKAPNTRKLNYYLGSIEFFDRKNTASARSYLIRELDNGWKDADTLYMLGVTSEYDSDGSRRAYSTGVDQAISYYNEALKMDPGHKMSLFNLSIAYSVRGKQDKAIETAEKLVKLEGVEGMLVPTYYNMACFYALKNDTAKAIENLKRSIDAGFNDFEHMRTDNDLASIRDKKEFKELLERYQGGGSVRLD